MKSTINLIRFSASLQSPIRCACCLGLLFLVFATGCSDTSDSASVANATDPAISDTSTMTATETTPDSAVGPATMAESASTSQAVVMPEPIAVVEPVDDAEPLVAAEPVSDTQPVATANPVDDTDPDVTAEPVNDTEPVATEEPVNNTELVATEEPVNDTEPVATEEPVNDTEPVATVEPTVVEQSEPALVADSVPMPPPVAEQTSTGGPQDDSTSDDLSQLTADEHDSDTMPSDDDSSRAFAASSGPSLQMVPDLLDNLYRYNVNSTSDLVTYQNADGSFEQLFIYWSDDRRLHVTKRSFPDGRFAQPIDMHDAGLDNNEPLRYDSHNTSAIGVASNGVMFVTGNHHVMQLNMAKTTTPYDLNSFARMLPEQMVAASEVDRVTYPSFFSHGGYLYFSYREQEVGQGAPRFRWMINRYDPARDEWKTAVQFNTGISLRLYVSNVAVAANDGSMHVFATWRDDTQGGGVASQRDYIHLYSINGTTWSILNSNTTVSATEHLWYDNNNEDLPGYTGIELATNEKIWSSPGDPIARSAGSAAVDAAGRPHAVVKDFAGTLFHHYWRDQPQNRWESRRLDGWAAQSFDIVACPSGMGVLLSANDRIYYRSLNPSDTSYDSPVLLAEGFITPEFTLSIDKEAIRFGFVSFLLTRNSHFNPETHNSGTNPQPAWVATFHCDQLENANVFSRPG